MSCFRPNCAGWTAQMVPGAAGRYAVVFHQRVAGSRSDSEVFFVLDDGTRRLMDPVQISDL